MEWMPFPIVLNFGLNDRLREGATSVKVLINTNSFKNSFFVENYY